MYERKKITGILVFTICLTVVLAITFGGFLSKAETKKKDAVYYKYYANIEIRPGDTLWTLADAYVCKNYESKEAYIEEVLQLNSLTDGDEIVSGQYLIMPYYSTEYKM